MLSTLTKEVWDEGFRFNNESADFINRIVEAEGVDAGLLAFTFWEEGKFNIWAEPNKNEVYDRKTKQDISSAVQDWDFGPFQLNFAWTHRDLKKGDYSSNGINVHDAFGFFGYGLVPFANGRLAARKLNFGGQIRGSDRGAAMYFTQGGRGGIRGQHWDQWGKKWQAFFKCYNAK